MSDFGGIIMEISENTQMEVFYLGLCRENGRIKYMGNDRFLHIQSLNNWYLQTVIKEGHAFGRNSRNALIIIDYILQSLQVTHNQTLRDRLR